MSAPTPSTIKPQFHPLSTPLGSHRLLVALAAISLGIASIPSPLYGQTGNETIYRETFTFCSATLGREAAQQTGWFALKSGALLGRIGFLKVFPYGNLDIGRMINSTPLGYAQGYSFWSKAVYGLSVLTDEFPLQASIFSNPATTVEYVQRLSGINAAFEPNKTHLLFLIDSTWYISDQGVGQINGGVGWEKVSVAPANLTYGSVPLIAGRGAEIPATGGEALPTTGTVRAFGIFLREVNGRVRLDNFSILTDGLTASSFSFTPQEPRTNACPAFSPDRGQSAPPEETPPPNDQEDDTSGTGPSNGVDQQIPDETPPPNLTPGPKPTFVATPQPSPPASPIPYAFCPTTEAGAGKALKPSVTVQKLLQKSTKRTTVDLRNRFIGTLLFKKRLPLGSMVNLTRGSYDPKGGTLTVPISPTQKVQQVRLGRSSQKVLNNYLASMTEDPSSQAPLFAALDPATKSISQRRALCLAEVTSIVRRYARSARLNTRLMFASSTR